MIWGPISYKHTHSDGYNDVGYYYSHTIWLFDFSCTSDIIKNGLNLLFSQSTIDSPIT